MTSWLRQHWHPGGITAATVFALGLCIAVAGAQWLTSSLDGDARNEFKRRTNRVAEEVARRFREPIYGMEGAKGLYSARGRVMRGEFRAYVESRDLSREFPGVLGFGFIQRIERSRLAAFVDAERADDAPLFALREMEHTAHPDLYVVKYIEPEARHAASVGLDMGSEPARRSAVERAVLNGEPTLTAATVVTHQGVESPGFLLYLPVFRHRSHPVTPAERHAKLVGLVFSPLVAADLLAGIYEVEAGLLNFELVDADDATLPGALVFESAAQMAKEAGTAAPAPRAAARYALARTVSLPGRELTLRVRSTAKFEAAYTSTLPWLIVGAGALASAMLSALLWQRAAGRHRAQRLADIIDATQVGTWEWNIRTGEARVDELWAKQLGYSLAELGPMTNRTWEHLRHPDEAASAQALLRRHFDGELDYYEAELRMRHKDGRWIWMLDRGRVSKRTADGQPVSMHGAYLDITARVHATQAAQEASRTKSQFLANMSHEIRTPMNAILGMLTLLHKTGLTARQSDYATKANRAARSLLGLLNEILDFSKIEAGKMTLDPHPFRIDELLRDLGVILSANIGSKSVEVLFDIDPNLPRQLLGDAMRLQQVLINLSGNAIKFTAEGEVVVSMAVVGRTATEVTVEISVRDTGIGIAPENHARIFGGFTQAEASTTRRFGGTGLGVAISQRLVRLMGGELMLDSALGQGSRFHFCITLPLDPACDPIDAAPQQPPAAMRALVIDDNPTARELLRGMGTSLGWTVEVADSGESAIALLQAQAAAGTSFQAVFVDWQMPGLDGWQTCQRIRELGLNDATPVIVMVTAHGQEMLAQRSETEQTLLDGFLVKPVTASMLFDAIVDARVQQAYPHPSRSGATGDALRLSGMHILVAEDNPNNQQVARELLEGEGAIVCIANNGQEAVAAVAAATPAFDIVLMDLQMPVMDGFAAVTLIRRDLGLSTLPVVAMTANAMASDREACLAAGMNDHVGKPFDLDHLVSVLCKQVGRQQAPARAVAATQLPARVGAAAADAGVDVGAAVARLGGKPEIYERMLRTFMHDLGEMPAQLQRQLAQGERVAASHQLHTLKGLAATLGASRLADEAAACEKQLAGGATAVDAAAVVQRACSAITAAGPGLAALAGALLAESSSHSSAAPRSQMEAPLPLDARALAAALRQIDEQLSNADMAATETMVELRHRFGAALGEALQPLEDAIGALDFEAALLVCRGLLDERNMELTA